MDRGPTRRGSKRAKTEQCCVVIVVKNCDTAGCGRVAERESKRYDYELSNMVNEMNL